MIVSKLKNPVRTRKAGFTLIELLVVVAIIAVLVAMLLPALSQARASAKKIQCSALQRNIGTAVQQYILAYNDYFPAACHDDSPFLKSSFMNILREFGILPKERHYVCPSDAAPYYGCKISDMGTPNVTGYYSYVYNSYCGQNSSYYPVNDVYLVQKRYSRQPVPDRMILLTDGYVSGNWYYFDWMGSYNINYERHRGTVICLFADNHVESVGPARALSYTSFLVPEY